MKSLFIVAGVATLAVSASATASVSTLGGPLAQSCYIAAEGSDPRASAIEGCTRALTEEGLLPTDRAATYVNRGIVQMVGGHTNAAEADFDSALAIDAGLADAYLNKGFLRLREGRGQEALLLLQKGIDAGPRRQALAYFARGVAYEQTGNYRSAYNDLQKARQMEPRWSLPREWLAHYQFNR